MKNSKRRGFTIVELVVVIAIIAILAAILIPTFSNITKKANLSADKQAVREMNEALAHWEAENGYGKVIDVETAMQILANAGYNTNQWMCLTAGYEVYWYKNDNRMILYNAAKAEIVYPDEYVGTKVMVTAENNFFLYNDNTRQAQSFDMGFSSITVDKAKAGASTDLANVTNTIADTNTHLTSVASENISAIKNAITSNTAIATSLKLSTGGTTTSNLVYYAQREVKRGIPNAYVSMQVAAVGTEGNPVVLTNSGEVAENLYYIRPVISSNATQEEIKLAQKETAKIVYAIFVQMTTGSVVDKATIILEPNTVLDCSANEWAPCKTFSGYFGTTDASKPVVISGARLTPATGHAATVAFNGSGSKYFVTGFFGTIYGNTTIENVKFENLTIANPASDYELTESDKGAKLINTRNTVGVIGGITDNYSANNVLGTPANVVLRNIVVESTVNITGSGCAGGLVGYIGSANSNADKEGTLLKGTITIEGCEIKANVTSTDNMSGGGYRAVGGVYGFNCRTGTELTININNTTFSGTLNGYGYLGAIAGATQNSYNINVTGGDYSEAKIATDTSKTPWKKSSAFGYIATTTGITISGANLRTDLKAAHNSDLDAANNVDYILDGTTLKKAE